MKSQLLTFATVSCTCQTNHTYNCSVHLAAIPHSHTSYSVHLLRRTYHMCHNPTPPSVHYILPPPPALRIDLHTDHHYHCCLPHPTINPTPQHPRPHCTTPSRIIPHYHHYHSLYHTPSPAVPNPPSPSQAVSYPPPQSQVYPPSLPSQLTAVLSAQPSHFSTLLV